MKCLLLACLLAACAHDDERPETLAYVTEAILAPNCGTANCHSTWKHEEDDVFDTVAGALAAMQNKNRLLLACQHGQIVLDPCDDARETYLYAVIDGSDRFGNRMPLDQPLANKDIKFISEWIDSGADGYVSLVGSN